MTKKIYLFMALLATSALQLQAATGCTQGNLFAITGNYCANSTGNYTGAATGNFNFNTTSSLNQSPCTPFAKANSNLSATITWTYPTSATRPTLGVALYYSTDGFNWICLDPNVTIGSTSYTTAPLPKSKYSFSVASIYEYASEKDYFLSNPSNIIDTSTLVNGVFVTIFPIVGATLNNTTQIDFSSNITTDCTDTSTYIATNVNYSNVNHSDVAKGPPVYFNCTGGVSGVLNYFFKYTPTQTGSNNVSIGLQKVSGSATTTVFSTSVFNVTDAATSSNNNNNNNNGCSFSLHQ